MLYYVGCHFEVLFKGGHKVYIFISCQVPLKLCSIKDSSPSNSIYLSTQFRVSHYLAIKNVFRQFSALVYVRLIGVKY